AGLPRSRARRACRARERVPRRAHRARPGRDGATPWSRSWSVLRVGVEEGAAALAFLLVDAPLGGVLGVGGVGLDRDDRRGLDLDDDAHVGRLDDAVVEGVEEDEGALLRLGPRLHDLVLADVFEQALEP